MYNWDEPWFRETWQKGSRSFQFSRFRQKVTATSNKEDSKIHGMNSIAAMSLGLSDHRISNISQLDPFAPQNSPRILTHK
jgi:hypothetical protein